MTSSAPIIDPRLGAEAFVQANTNKAPAVIPHTTVRAVDAQPRIPSEETAEPVSGNVVAKVAVGLGAPDTVTVGTLAIGPGWVPLSAGTLLTIENLGEMA